MGRKPVILVGLALLAAGLFLSFLADNIYLLIISRALQGSGAIMAIAYSWINDGVEDDKKSRAMSMAGVIVAIGGVAAFVIGPLLYKVMSVRYMFLGSAVLIIFTFIFILFSIKEKVKPSKTKSLNLNKQMKYLLSQKNVVALSICGFINNYLCIEIFNIIPTEIKNTIGAGSMWMIFLPAVLCGIAAMKITSAIMDKGHYRAVAAGAFITAMLGWAVLIPKGIVFITIGTILNMISFMCLTAGVPAQLNKLVTQEARGAANGIMQSMSYLGVFFGPTIAGFLIQIHVSLIIYLISIILALAGAFISMRCNVNIKTGLILKEDDGFHENEVIC